MPRRRRKRDDVVIEAVPSTEREKKVVKKEIRLTIGPLKCEQYRETEMFL